MLYIYFYFLGGMLYSESSAVTMEELRAVKYEVDLSKAPLKNVDIDPNLFVLSMTASNGKEYQCTLPHIEEDELAGKVGTSIRSVDIKSLLKPMYEGNCIYKVKGWWTYELCFGKAIRQFHIEDGQITGEIITLGLYSSDYEWENEDMENLKRIKQVYHSQFYFNGTNCDLTGLPRTTEVRIFCEDDSMDYINWIDEPATCNYVIAVHTSHACSHPMLKVTKKAYTIPCHPLPIDDYSLLMLDIAGSSLEALEEDG